MPSARPTPVESDPMLTPQELLAGGALVHDIDIPASVLNPGQADDGVTRRVRLRPLKVATLALISKAAREDASLAPLLIVKEALVEPVLGFDQVRQLHAGLVQFLVAEANRISGLDGDGGAARAAAASPIGEAHLLLARHYGWTPAQVGELSPGQMAVYLAGLHSEPDGGSA
jgi:hypothetical protein